MLLGSASTEGLPVDLFASGEARWLGIRVGVEPEQARILLVSVPYALKAAEAERLGGLTAEDFVLAGQFSDQVRKEVEEQVAAEAEKIQAATISVGGAKEITEAGVRSTFTDTNTTEVVFIDQLGTGMGLRARSTSGTAITGASTALTGPAPGVSGVSKADIGKGILGRVTHPTGLTMGIRGETLSTAGRGIVGIAEATSGPTIGIQAVTFSPEGVGIELVTKTVGGQLFRGLSGQPAVEVFSISGTGDVVAASFAGDGSLLINVPGAAGGTVTSVATGLGLTGGTITTSGTLSIDTAVVPQLNAANTFTTGTQTVQTGAATTTGLVVQGAAGQTASLLEVQDSAGVKLASVEADGTLEITSGDIKIRGAGRGFFMMSPDGTECARIILGNSGQLHVTSIVCPIP